jgi:hypothetical protein
MIDFELKQNARTAGLGFATNERCGRCGCVTSAYLKVMESSSLFVSREVICKGCLLEGVDMIDKGILDQAKTRV